MPVSTREGNCLHKHFTARYRSVHSFLQDSPTFDMDHVSESVFEAIFASVIEERFPGKSHRKSKESLARSHKSQGYVRHIANRTWSAPLLSFSVVFFQRNQKGLFTLFSE